jgi:hypothetical protein
VLSDEARVAGEQLNLQGRFAFEYVCVCVCVRAYVRV